MATRFFYLFFPGVLLLLAPSWVDAGQASVVESMLQHLELYATSSANSLTLFTAVALATLISEDLACIAAGLLAAQSIISPWGAVAASAFGIYVGDILLYLAGYLMGISVLQRAPLKWIVKEKRVLQCKNLFERRGVPLIIMSRFLPGTRTATYIGAGIARMRLTTLLGVFLLSVLIWTPLLVLAAMMLGIKVVPYVELYSRYGIWVFFGSVALLIVVLRGFVPLFTWRGRRLLLSRWRRLSCWEFWPFYITNIVTFLYVLFLGIFKYRQLTLFTVTNPVVKPDSGFIGERKSEIYGRLQKEYLGRWFLVKKEVPVEEKPALCWSFMKGNNLNFPIVLKPDRGERGKEVRVCQTSDDLLSGIEGLAEDFIVMEYLPGEEFGVFYYRYPGEDAGVIFSITRKKMVAVIGNGTSTLEELILRDERAMCLAPTFFKRHHNRLLDIIDAGESVSLVDIGTHRLGSMFLDGIELDSPELLVALEKILDGYNGFYFGRFDLKAESEEALRTGRALKVIELNALTSEATHIYDPKNSLITAWKVLMRQWSIAFEIADRNKKRGHRPMSLKAFLGRLIKKGVVD